VWQLPIGDKIWPLMRHEAQMTRAMIFVVDSASPERFAELREQMNMLLATPELKDAPVLIYANKQDLENAATAAEVSEALQLASIGRPWYDMMPFIFVLFFYLYLDVSTVGSFSAAARSQVTDYWKVRTIPD
jgi:signal recognition particle receptor subunit beta